MLWFWAALHTHPSILPSLARPGLPSPSRAPPLSLCMLTPSCPPLPSPPKAYMKEIRAAEQEAARFDAVFPCVLKIMPTCIFNKKDPIVVGVEVTEGIAKVWGGRGG